MPIALHGTTFQQSVWNLLQTIPYGKTRSYGEVADSLGNRLAIRVVGLANSRNPISIIIPCHRIVGSNGGLTGYAGGLERMRWLLELEAANITSQKQLNLS
ncbi:methylated-DNA--[protein]-cysteine S-methyltransferase [Granulicella sp. dw_53]|uniref:methylated-DNA--[protein]-cysteine S-methyltransferase n=1 Tax=Granulicella sp. dw_53 TaxID=2719792 RepID=UPI0023DF9962|nr:methylated-DNA--[protein]-cysteine S-methyltransferase [Granulicella sp. dw_53]